MPQERRSPEPGRGRGPARKPGDRPGETRGAPKGRSEGGRAGASGKPSRGAPAGSTGSSRSGSGRGHPSDLTKGGDKPWSRPRGEDDRRKLDRASGGDRAAEQARYDGPPLDESITGAELDRSVRQQLRGLPEKLATRVARHLVAAGQLIETDPATAYQHTLAARARATRVAVVREACGEAAYAAGEFADALSELRAARRINGATDYLPVMADCERALGRPEKALTLAKSPAVANLPPELQAEMTIVEAGARRDRGEMDAALRTLENAPLRSKTRAAWVVRLRYAYADTLLAAGRTEDAVEWFHRTAGIDSDGVTDAAERLGELDGVTLIEDDTQD